MNSPEGRRGGGNSIQACKRPHGTKSSGKRWTLFRQEATGGQRPQAHSRPKTGEQMTGLRQGQGHRAPRELSSTHPTVSPGFWLLVCKILGEAPELPRPSALGHQTSEQPIPLCFAAPTPASLSHPAAARKILSQTLTSTSQLLVSPHCSSRKAPLPAWHCGRTPHLCLLSCCFLYPVPSRPLILNLAPSSPRPPSPCPGSEPHQNHCLLPWWSRKSSPWVASTCGHPWYPTGHSRWERQGGQRRGQQGPKHCIPHQP